MKRRLKALGALDITAQHVVFRDGEVRDLKDVVVDALGATAIVKDTRSGVHRRVGAWQLITAAATTETILGPCGEHEVVEEVLLTWRQRRRRRRLMPWPTQSPTW